MKGLELAQYYFHTVGRPALEKSFPALLPRMAIGLAGEGSECFGYDDALSRDHDWGPGFCIWLQESDYHRYGAQVQALYNSLPGEAAGFPARKNGSQGGGRVGCLCAADWYRRYTGCPDGPATLAEWRRVPESFLATATNGEIFFDPLGQFSAVRQKLLGFYPEDVRIKKIAARAAMIAQSGQYNYPRSLDRGEPVAARLALSEFILAATSMMYLLSRKYAPFYKWRHRGLQQLQQFPRAHTQFLRLSEAESGVQAQERIEGICLTIVAALRRQGLTSRNDAFLQLHTQEIMQHIQDPALRETHVMEE